MTRKNKILFALSILIILAPLAVGLLMLDRLTAATPTMHGYILFSVIFAPLFFLLLHIPCVLLTLRDCKRNAQSEKIVTLAVCILPAISIFFAATLFFVTSKESFVPYTFVYILLGALFILMGNYMPKARRNRLFGVKTVWTLSSDDIWTRTHRFTGKLGVIVGSLLMICALLPQSTVLLVCAVLGAALIVSFGSMLYSYVIYKKAVKAGTLSPDAAKPTKGDKIARVIVIPAVLIILAACACLMFTGNIEITAGEDALTVDATYFRDVVIAYEDIESVALIKETNVFRVNGFSSPRLSLGLFTSDQLGNHSRFAYTKAEVCIVLRLKNETVVLSAESEEATRALYETICEKAQQNAPTA